MKIVNICLTSPYKIGLGYQENLLTKYQAIDKSNEVTIITPSLLDGNQQMDAKREFYDGKVKIIGLNNGINNKLNTIFRHYEGLYEALEFEKPDFIFVHGIQFIDSLIVCKYLKEHKDVRSVVDNHADKTNSAMSFSTKLLHKTLWKYCAGKTNRYVDKFYGVIPIRCDFLHEMYGIPNDRIDLLVMGGDDEYIRSAKDNRINTRRDYGVGDVEFLIVTGGKIDKYKTDTIKLMEEVNRLSNIKVKLIVFGSIEKEVQNTFNKNLSDKVSFVGWINQKQIYELLCASDLAFFPGRHSVLWEQVVACGIPAVFKDINNTKHVDIGGNCLFMKDSSEIKDILNYVLQKDNYKKMYVVANTNRKDQFLYSNIAKKSLEFAYKDI